MNTLTISIGSNSKDRDWQIKNCIEWLKSILKDTKVSSIYNSPAVSGADPDYMNAVMNGKCKETFDKIIAKLKEYETVCGRTPASKLEGIIPLDLDIVLWNGIIIRERDYNHSYFQKGWIELNK